MNIRSTTLALITAVALAAPAFGQESAQAKPETKPAPEPKVQESRGPSGRDANIRVDVTITEQTGTAPATTKSVTMVCADQNWCRIRNDVRVRPWILNVDARPILLNNSNSRMQMNFVLEYRPGDEEPAKNFVATINEQLVVMLDDGKPLIVSQSADPNSDRKVKLEVKATILR